MLRTFTLQTQCDLTRTEFVVADCETTGLDPASDRIVEFALVRFANGRPRDRFAALVDPMIPIPCTASAVHTLRDDDVAGRPSIADYADDIVAFVGGAHVVAHNSAFDEQFLTMLNQPYICTYRLARRLWPDAPKHTNAVLRYWLSLDDQFDLESARAHRAEGDALVTGHLFMRQLAELQCTTAVETLDDVIDLCWSPIPITVFHYGRKFRGRLITEIETGYLNWVYSEQIKPSSERKITIDADTISAVEAELTSRHFPR